jgi:putative pantetheine hydrolase
VASAILASGETVSAIVVANAFGDVIAEDGTLLGAPRGDAGELVSTARLIAGLPQPPHLAAGSSLNTTLACVCTDASLDKRGCAIAARVASAGIARAVNPAFTLLDGDVTFLLASGRETSPAPGIALSWSQTVIGAVAAEVVAAAIRDAVIQSVAAGGA